MRKCLNKAKYVLSKPAVSSLMQILNVYPYVFMKYLGCTFTEKDKPWQVKYILQIINLA